MHALWPKVEDMVPQLWRAVSGYELNPALREELFQEVLLAIWEALPGLRDQERLLPFALRITHNLGASHVRAATRHPAPLALDESVHGAAGAERSDGTRSEWLFEALATLPVKLRQPIMLQLEGFDYREIAEMLGITTENVGVRIHRARELLKALSREDEKHGH